MPAGSEAVVTAGTGLMVIDKERVAVVLRLSVTMAVKVDVALALGVP